MDGKSFDAYTRIVTKERSRRGTLALLAGALATHVRGRERTAEAACKKVGKNCDKNKDCCDGAQCKGKKCKCKSGRDECGGKCYDLDKDENHCGDCNTVCGAHESCCDGVCVSLSSDRDHCASCGAACARDELCVDGACTPCPVGNQICGDVCCPPFRACCDGTCVDELESNPDHCGACGNHCPGICGDGPDGSMVCHGPRCCSSGQCVDDVQSNPDHCGACDNACGPDETCCDGVCGGTCGNSYCACHETCCDGECVDLQRDDDHCGSCDVECVPNQTCQEGRCKRIEPM